MHREYTGDRDFGRAPARSSKSDADGGGSEFSCQANVARGNIQQLLTNVNSITRLSSALGTPKDTVDLRERLHRIIEETKLLSVDTKTVLRDLNTIANGGYQGGGSGNQKHKVEARKLNDEFQKALQRYQEAVRSTVHMERESIVKAKRVSTEPSEDDERQGLMDRERASQFLQTDRDLDFSEALILEREQGIREIERSMNDVNEIYRDLASLIGQQANVLDDIESGMVNTAQRSEAAAKELKQAAASQKKARRTMACLAVALVLVGTLIVLIMTKVI